VSFMLPEANFRKDSFTINHSLFTIHEYKLCESYLKEIRNIYLYLSCYRKRTFAKIPSLFTINHSPFIFTERRCPAGIWPDRTILTRLIN
ncbi:MAG: hypothetical protein KAW56_14140, partial [Candidatus Marinimicrobia bacterium]|nr:hypothetical protein [Candidatus Neomarinimicrobiota bacterium]